MSQVGNRTKKKKQTVQNIAAMSPSDEQQTDSKWPLHFTRMSPFLCYSLLNTDGPPSHTNKHTGATQLIFSDEL